MNPKLIHAFLFVLLLTMSTHVVHTAVLHDAETCEVCIHAQSNDDWSDERSEHYLVFDTALHAQFNGANHLSVNTTPNTADLIRGSPSFYLI